MSAGGDTTRVRTGTSRILGTLAARAAYFHNGAAATLDEVVDFSGTRLNVGLAAREKRERSE
jgi:cytochrome c peroxidase